FMSQVIDRGLIPLMGLALLCLGCWISTYQRQPLNLKPIIMRVVTLLSLALALVYLVVAPFYFSENRLASAQTTQTLNEQVSQAELQLENRLNQELGLISNLMDDETQLQQQLQGQALNAAQQSQLDNIMAQLQQFKDDPEALQQRTAEARNTALAQLRRQQGQALQQSRYRFLRDALRLSLSSFVLAIGYLTLAIVGLQQRQT
ncbi:MAG: HpsJ family protein, partial [Prochlorothrix sp.]